MSVLNDKILQQHFQRKHREMQLTPLIQLEGPGQHSPHPLSPKEMTCLRLSSNERHAQKKNITNIYIYIWLHNDEANKRMITPLDNLASFFHGIFFSDHGCVLLTKYHKKRMVEGQHSSNKNVGPTFLILPPPKKKSWVPGKVLASPAA